jgi:Uma2 family endonuclease
MSLIFHCFLKRDQVIRRLPCYNPFRVMSLHGTIKMTARQFSQLGEDPPGVHLELVDGEITVSPSPQPQHSRVDKRLTRILLNHIVEKDLGELLGDTDTVFGPFDVRRPDLIYISKAHEILIDARKPLQFPPDLCVEIISPSSGAIDREDKFEQYATGGVPNYWLLDPEAKTIEAFVLRDGSYQPAGEGRDKDVVHLPPFPDLAIPLGELWLPSRP